jgi:hypothetical protein
MVIAIFWDDFYTALLDSIMFTYMYMYRHWIPCIVCRHWMSTPVLRVSALVLQSKQKIRKKRQIGVIKAFDSVVDVGVISLAMTTHTMMNLRLSR